MVGFLFVVGVAIAEMPDPENSEFVSKILFMPCLATEIPIKGNLGPSHRQPIGSHWHICRTVFELVCLFQKRFGLSVSPSTPDTMTNGVLKLMHRRAAKIISFQSLL